MADANSMAGVVRLHAEAKALKLRPVIGCRIETVEGLVLPRLPGGPRGLRASVPADLGRADGDAGGEWQDKGVCEITLAMLAEWSAKEARGACS